MTTSSQVPSNYSKDDPCDEWKEFDKLPKTNRDSPVNPVQRPVIRPKQSDV